MTKTTLYKTFLYASLIFLAMALIGEVLKASSPHPNPSPKGEGLNKPYTVIKNH